MPYYLSQANSERSVDLSFLTDSLRREGPPSGSRNRSRVVKELFLSSDNTKARVYLLVKNIHPLVRLEMVDFFLFLSSLCIVVKELLLSFAIQRHGFTC